jgi:hypothetical protein
MTTILRAAQAPRFDIPGVTFVGMASPSRGSEQLCTWKIIVAIPAGFSASGADGTSIGTPPWAA